MDESSMKGTRDGGKNNGGWVEVVDATSTLFQGRGSKEPQHAEIGLKKERNEKMFLVPIF